MATPARPHIDSGYFFQQLERAKRSILVVDFDTTLQIATPRRSALPVPSLQELLECIILAPRARVIVSSKRSARDVLRYFHPLCPEIWGREGLERIPAAVDAAGAVSFRIAQRPQTATFSTLLLKLCAGGPVAYVVGERTPGVARDRLSVRPEFYLSPTEVSLGEDRGI